MAKKYINNMINMALGKNLKFTCRSRHQRAAVFGLL
jgi:hypothetical protein